MDKNFKDVIELLAKEQGKETLVNGKTKLFLSDYCKGQFKKETAIFLQILDANCGELINNADNVPERKQKLMALLEKDNSLSPKVTAEYLDLLGLILKGDTSESVAQFQVTPVQAEQTQTAQKAATSSITTNGEITLKNGDVYEGEMLNGKPHGKGKLTSKDEKVYEGDFVNGKLHGKGKITIKGGPVYEGDFVEGEMSGKGKVTTSETVYEGDFEKSLFHGKGKITYTNGDVFEGEFVWGHGEGIMTYKNGKVKEGTFENYEFKGKGLFGGLFSK